MKLMFCYKIWKEMKLVVGVEVEKQMKTRILKIISKTNQATKA